MKHKRAGKCLQATKVSSVSRVFGAIIHVNQEARERERCQHTRLGESMLISRSKPTIVRSFTWKK